LQTDDIEKMLEFVKERGITLISGPEEIPGVAKWFFVCDPDQNVIEFYQDFQVEQGKQ
jgi:predicted enzyme related to lactoylglutathione lyase